MKTPAAPSRLSRSLVVCAGALALFGACKNDAEKSSSSGVKPAPASPSAPSPASTPKTTSEEQALEPPITLLELNESAYRATVKVDEEAIYLLTETAAYRFVPEKEPLRMPLDLGVAPALTASSIVFWSKGAVFAAPKTGGEPRKLAQVARQPQAFVAAEDRFAWLDRDEEGKSSIVTLVGGKPRVAHTASGSIAAITMLGGEAFFVEVAKDDSWRIGGVSLDGGEPRFTKVRTGRSPSMLFARRDLFYYDGPRRSVLRLSPDLANEEALGDKVICSPITVSERVVCAQVGSIFELSLDSRGAPRRLVENPGFVTAIADGRFGAVWLRDNGKSGEDKLALRLVPVPTPKPATK